MRRDAHWPRPHPAAGRSSRRGLALVHRKGRARRDRSEPVDGRTDRGGARLRAGTPNGSPGVPAGRPIRDSVHARCSAYVDRRLQAAGWVTAREVEIVHGRSHGWIDLLAFDPRTGTLLIIEVKTRLDDLGALERQVGWYERMAWPAARRMGWRPRRTTSIVLALASDEVERVVRAHRDLMALAFPMRAAVLIADPSSMVSGARGFALIDPSSRRRDWLIRTSTEGRRSRLPYRDYAGALRPAARSIAPAPADTNEPSDPRPMNRNPISTRGGSPAAS